MSTRYRQILKAIIAGHIETAEPVGSGTVSRRSRLGISSATVRNVMAQLEEMGYLVSPHASAGRVPTRKAYRYYVESLLKLGPLSVERRQAIEKRYRHGVLPVEYELQSAGRALSDISRYAGIVVVPRFSSTIFRHLEFVRLNDRRLLVVLVSASGMVHKKPIDIDEPVKQSQLDQAANYLNRTLSGLSIKDARERIAREVGREKALYDELSRWTLQLSREALEDPVPRPGLHRGHLPDPRTARVRRPVANEETAAGFRSEKPAARTARKEPEGRRSADMHSRGKGIPGLSRVRPDHRALY
ncbi:MAG: heat-inducible transcription repressor HrcA [Desulfuromonadales bacterium]|nr:heat-inducible transcription repressor HrcA [Desulfuromonadales bacterium]